jgi:hypothetical protein
LFIPPCFFKLLAHIAGVAVAVGAGSGSRTGVGVARGLGLGEGVGVAVGVGTGFSWARDSFPEIPKENENKPNAHRTNSAAKILVNLFFIASSFRRVPGCQFFIQCLLTIR